MFFTRLPFWRWYQPHQDAFKAVVEFWPLTGWLTAGVMAGVLYASSLVFPYTVAVLLAIISRLMLTGALHEDGLADFFDGFGGGGSNRQRILDIMKDSHIGTYGVLALILYLALLFATLLSMQPTDAALTILMADPYAKMISAPGHPDDALRPHRSAGQESCCLSQVLLGCRHQSGSPGPAARGVISLVDAGTCRLAVACFSSLSHDVFPVPADMAPSSRLYR